MNVGDSRLPELNPNALSFEPEERELSRGFSNTEFSTFQDIGGTISEEKERKRRRNRRQVENDSKPLLNRFRLSVKKVGRTLKGPKDSTRPRDSGTMDVNTGKSSSEKQKSRRWLTKFGNDLEKSRKKEAKAKSKGGIPQSDRSRKTSLLERTILKRKWKKGISKSKNESSGAVEYAQDIDGCAIEMPVLESPSNTTAGKADAPSRPKPVASKSRKAIKTILSQMKQPFSRSRRVEEVPKGRKSRRSVDQEDSLPLPKVTMPSSPQSLDLSGDEDIPIVRSQRRSKKKDERKKRVPLTKKRPKNVIERDMSVEELQRLVDRVYGRDSIIVSPAPVA
jgi:hypothetical protein